jgi:hypothetical protein
MSYNALAALQIGIGMALVAGGPILVWWLLGGDPDAHDD